MRTAVLIFSLALLGGCSIIDRIGNKPYSFPSESEPHAEITLHSHEGSWFNIFNIDSNGCFAGTSSIATSGKTVRLHAGKETYISLEKRSAASFCRIIVAFTPEQNSKYIFKQGSMTQQRDGILGAISGPASYCTISGAKLDELSEAEPLAIKKMKLVPNGLACLKMRPTN